MSRGKKEFLAGFPEALMAARLRRGLSRPELGEAVARTESAVGKWERGKSEPSLSELKKVIVRLRVPPGSLLGLEERAGDAIELSPSELKDLGKGLARAAALIEESMGILAQGKRGRPVPSKPKARAETKARRKKRKNKDGGAERI